MIKRLFIFILLIILLLIGSLIFIGSETGSKLAWDFVAKKYPDQISAEKMNGGLANSLHFEKLNIKLIDLDVVIDQLDFKWTLSKLFQKKLVIDNVKVNGVLIDDRRPKIEEEKEPFVLQDINIPLTVEITNLLLSDLEYRSIQSERPIILNEFSLALLVEPKQISLRHASAKVPEANLNISGQLKPTGDYPLSFALDWLIHLPEQPELQGAGNISGDLKKLHINQQITKPATADLKVQLDHPMTDLTWLADVDLQSLHLQQVKSDLPEILFKTKIHGKGDLENIQLSGNYSMNSDDFGDWNGLLDIAQKLPTDLTINQFELNSIQTPAKINLTGKINLTDSPDLSLDGSWEKLKWPLSGDVIASSEKGDLKITGKPDDFILNFSGAVNHAQVGDVSLALKGHGYDKDNTKSFIIEQLISELLDGRIDLNGQVTMAEDLTWDLALKGANINPKHLQKDWPGKLNINSKVTGSQSDEHLKLTLSETKISGQLRDYPFNAETDLKLIDQMLDINKLIVTSGKSKLEASGKAAQNLDLKWNLKSNNLAELYPDASGQLTATGSVKGPQKKPIINAKINATKLAAAGVKLAELSSTFKLDLSQVEGTESADGFDIQLNTSNVEVGENVIDNFDLVGTGSLAKHKLQTDLKSKLGNLHLLTQGGLQNEQWRGLINELDIEEKQLGLWNLAKPQPISLSKKQADLDSLCLTQKSAKLCLGAHWKESGTWLADSTLSQLPLSLLQPFLPPDMVLNSTVGYELEASGTGSKNLRAKLNLEAPAGKIRLSDADELSSFEYDQAKLDFIMNEKGVNADLLFDLTQPTASPIKAQLTTPAFDLSTLDINKLPIEARLTSKIDDLAFVQNLTHELEQLKGDLDIDLGITGTIKKPKIEGHTKLSAEFYVPSAGIHLKEIKLAAINQADQSIAITGQAKSGEGELKITGSVGSAEAGFPINAEITGDRFEVVNLPEAWVVATPKIAIQQQKDTLNIEGEVTIPEAKIEPQGMESSITVSDDVVFISNEKNSADTEEKKTSAMQVSSKVKIILGDKISIASSGFSGMLTGNLLALMQPTKAPSATGEINIKDGKYSAYGQKLTIDKGQIVFAGGPIDSPNLDIQASRKIEDISAGIYVTGPATSPELTLYSNPIMNQDNILSYIMIGKPLSEATSGDSDLLIGAASSLGFKGGAMLTQSIGQNLGLDEFELGGDSKEDASLKIGKYLSPKLYISYGVGIFEAATQLKLRYDFSKRWSMEAESGTNSGMDFLYKIEK